MEWQEWPWVLVPMTLIAEQIHLRDGASTSTNGAVTIDAMPTLRQKPTFTLTECGKDTKDNNRINDCAIFGNPTGWW